jgi:hypothetical protein
MSDSSPSPADPGTPQPTGSSGHRTRIAKVTKRARFRFRWIAYGALALLIAGFAARPVYRWTKQIRAERLVGEVERLIRENRLAEAGRQLQVASQLAPHHPSVIRANAQYLSRLLRPEALAVWQHLVDIGGASKADRQRYAEIALRLHRIDLAGEQLRVLTADENPSPEICYLAVQHFRLRRDFPGAVAAAREALQIAKTNSDSRFLLGTVLVESPDPRHRAEGRRWLVDLASAPGPHSDDAFDLLLLHPEMPVSDAQRLLEAFNARTNLALPDQVRVASLRVRLDPAGAGKVGDELVTAVTSMELSSRIPVGIWLGSRGLNEQVLRLLPADVALTNALALPVRLEALVRLARWHELEPLLNRTDFPLDPVFGGGIRAAFAVHQTNLVLAETHLREALATTSNRVDRLQFVSRYAENLGFPRVAVEAQMELLYAPGRTWQSGQEILRLSATLDDAATAKQMLDRLERLMPGDPGVTAEQAYYRLLFGEDIPQTRKRIAELRNRISGNLLIEIIAAFAELRAGNAAEALSRIESLQADWNRQPLRWQAVYVAALGAGERREAAREAARRIDLRQLRAQERELVRPWL